MIDKYVTIYFLQGMFFLVAISQRKQYNSFNECFQWYCSLYFEPAPFALVKKTFHGCTLNALTHWGRVTHICVSKLNIIGSVNGLLPGRRQAIIWTNAGIMLIEPLRTKFSESFIEIHTLPFNKMHLKISYTKCRPFFAVSMCWLMIFQGIRY